VSVNNSYAGFAERGVEKSLHRFATPQEGGYEPETISTAAQALPLGAYFVAGGVTVM
jgi:hypothetical protein